MDAIFMQIFQNSFFFRNFASSIASGFWLSAFGSHTKKDAFSTCHKAANCL